MYLLGNYSVSLYLFQQAVEKVCKYISLSSKFIEEDKLKSEISHSFLKVIKLYLKKSQERIGDYSSDGHSDSLNSLVQLFHSEDTTMKVVVSTEVIKNFVKSTDLIEIQEDESYTDFLKRVSKIVKAPTSDIDFETL